ncbi:hypothetical protein D9619_009790 [Psilocybe cf. subviscida]|uniref:Plus3 domain-containing protein n=1 Tax=Psilocybe cf. subviscida TaxID=2480587 RepID=A0A8H5BMW2_9AGAR|nr:hypothetical protein D9619_009790 [Psilocybe cf. subviscida]
MSEFEDELLELAGATEKKRKRRQPSNGSGGGGGATSNKSSKKRRAERMDSDSEKSVESEEEIPDPYPLEGKYRDEADKRELMAMSELQREEILEQRSNSRGRVKNARMLADFRLQQQNRGSAVADDAVSKAAKRQHTARGATKEKSSKLDELKAKRKAKDEKKRSNGGTSPSHRERSSSPQDMDISDSDSEDGQISKSDQEEMRINNLTSGYDHKRNREYPEIPWRSTVLGLGSKTIYPVHGCVTSLEAKTGSPSTGLVKLTVWKPPSPGETVVLPISGKDLAPNFVKPYKVNDTSIDQALELKHGKSTKTFLMDKVSNAPFADREFDRLVSVCRAEEVKLPTKAALEKKVAQMQKLVALPVTESDINAMVARKKQLSGATTNGLSTMDKAMLAQQRTLAVRRQDFKEVAMIDAKLEEAASKSPKKPEKLDAISMVNVRNRKANLESSRKAEQQEFERKKLERKMAAENPDAAKPIDPSARLKIAPRTFSANTPTTTRPGTPVVNGGTGANTHVKSGLVDAPAAEAPVEKGSSFEASVINSIEIDLGDF